MAKRVTTRSVGAPSAAPAAPSPAEHEKLEVSVAALSGLNVDRLRLQWRNHLGGIAPAHLPGWLLTRVLAYRIQAAAFRDLDRATLRRLREPSDGALDTGTPVPFRPAGRRRARASGSCLALCWCANGTAVWSGS
jgi:hypothetical protein